MPIRKIKNKSFASSSPFLNSNNTPTLNSIRTFENILYPHNISTYSSIMRSRIITLLPKSIEILLLKNLHIFQNPPFLHIIPISSFLISKNFRNTAPTPNYIQNVMWLLFKPPLSSSSIISLRNLVSFRLLNDS